jgi:hypothetical protein
MPQLGLDSASSNHGSINQLGAAIRSVARMVIALLIVGSLVLVSGCRDKGTTIWSKEVRSPDGQWLAAAATKQWSGAGTAYVATSVYLKWMGGSQPPIEILGFSNDSAYPSGITNVKMEWVTPKHLEVTYGSHAKLDFQAVKCNGIDISVRDLSSGITNSSQ